MYLFIGEDTPSKDAQLARLKTELLRKDTESFNLDTLYGHDLTLNQLQERLLFLPAADKKRLVVIRDAGRLKEEVRRYLAAYSCTPARHVVLVLDFDHLDAKDEYLQQVVKKSRVMRFKETIPPDTFALARNIEAGRQDYALRVLHQLLKKGEKPERILGGLRYGLLRSASSVLEKKKRLRLLLACDVEIKTGRLKPVFALEKTVVGLCGWVRRNS